MSPLANTGASAQLTPTDHRPLLHTLPTTLPSSAHTAARGVLLNPRDAETEGPSPRTP